MICFNTQPPEGGCPPRCRARCRRPAVSTHSRPKAAASSFLFFRNPHKSFNTQPPEGGCNTHHQSGKGRQVSTHSRPKAAAVMSGRPIDIADVSTHSRPKAAARGSASVSSTGAKFQHTAARRRLRRFILSPCKPCCFNTQPPEGGCARPHGTMPAWTEFQHTAARRRLLIRCSGGFCLGAFQHTAARRRLPDVMVYLCEKSQVSTHSRPKAAAQPLCRQPVHIARFNTQPPEGGCHTALQRLRQVFQFQHTAARRRLRAAWPIAGSGRRFQHTAARRRLRKFGAALFRPPRFQHTAARRRLHTQRRL